MANTHGTLSELFAAIADAIRGKTGSTAKIVADDFPDAIASISGGGDGVTLPTLTNPAVATDLAKGKELIDADGDVVTGTLKDGGNLTLTGGTLGMYMETGGTRGVKATAEAETDMILRAGGEVSVVTTYDRFGDATADDVAAGKTFTSAAGLRMTGTASGGTGDNIPDGTNVTFGNVDGTPVEREAVYAISSEDLNALGAIVQRSLGTEALMTFAEIINALELMEFMPVGYANCVLDGAQLTMFETNAIGSLEV